ncbi:MAG: FHA domain-containing protein [Anaerolineales bacterium]|nr:FHA domain-containing protein [Anaerolineales bacterium]
MSGVVLLVLRLVMAVALYAFLGWAVYTLWRDMQRQKDIIDARKIPEINLQVEIENQSESYPFSAAELVIGRDRTCDLVLDANTVSAEHARFSYHHQNWWIEDLGSRNGTFLNLERITTPSILVTGDELQIGQALIKISILDEAIERSSSLSK